MQDLTPCFGFSGCDDHGSCARYHAVETSSSLVRWGTCPVDRVTGKRTLYVPMFITRSYPDVERRAANAIEQPPVERRHTEATKEAA